jgi:hypothetical protein
MDDTVWGGSTVRVVLRHVFNCMCLGHTWHEALSCSVWLDSHVDMFGLGLIYLSMYMMVVEMHTWSLDWKRVIIITIVVIQKYISMLHGTLYVSRKSFGSVQRPYFQPAPAPGTCMKCVELWMFTSYRGAH